MKARIKVMQIGHQHYAIRKDKFAATYLTGADIKRAGGWIEALMVSASESIRLGYPRNAEGTLAAITIE